MVQQLRKGSCADQHVPGSKYGDWSGCTAQRLQVHTPPPPNQTVHGLITLSCTSGGGGGRDLSTMCSIWLHQHLLFVRCPGADVNQDFYSLDLALFYLYNIISTTQSLSLMPRDNVWWS